MLDFSHIDDGEITLSELASGLTKEDFYRFTNDMIDTMLEMIAECEDSDVTFVSEDPEAYDPEAELAEDVDLSWTLGHVIVHTTASAEESAAIAAELARGVSYRGGRSRYEVPWQSVTSVKQCRERLEESRRMRLASLDMWPDQPDLENKRFSRTGKPINAQLNFLFGLHHDNSHLEQLARIVSQAKLARQSAVKI